MASLEFVPLLGLQRELYDIPTGRERFERYIQLIRSPSGALELPLAFMNPMGKSHVAECLDAWIALGAEEVAQKAIEGVSKRLESVPLDAPLRFALVIVDDAAGGWTNRYSTEMQHRFGRSGELSENWATGMLWTSEEPQIERLEREVRSAAYRAVHRLRCRPALSLDEMLVQEGRAAVFAESRGGPGLADEPVLDEFEPLIEPHLDSQDLPIQMACLYGDEVAATLGYRALGVPPSAGYHYARRRARNEPFDPVEALLGT